jgi:hypothetical protein
MPVDYVVKAVAAVRSTEPADRTNSPDRRHTNLWAENFEFDSAWEDVLKVQQVAGRSSGRFACT